jgi:hypothetical protein
MKATYPSVMLPSLELHSVGVKCFHVAEIPPHCDRKPRSTGEGGSIIDSNQETIAVKWGPGIH